MLDEIWKEIKNYEDYYEISNYGRIRRIKYDNIGNKFQYNIPKYLKLREDKDGYLRCDLSLNGKIKRFFVHRLVAKAFVDNRNNNPVVNHIDGNKQNNYYKNLEFCTIKQNNLHVLKTGLRNMKNNKLSKEVEQYSMDNVLIKTYKSANDASRITGLSQGHISECCRGEIKQYKGYIWKYKINQTSSTIEKVMN